MATLNGYSTPTLNGNWFESRLDLTKDVPSNVKRRLSNAPISMGPYPDRWKTTTNSLHCRPATNPTYVPARMINFSNYHKSPVQEQGVSSALPHHSKDRVTREMSVSSHSAYGGPYADKPENTRVPADIPRSIACGITNVNRTLVTPGKQTDSVLGEFVKVDNVDPKFHTLVQRAWMSNQDIYNHYLERPTQQPRHYNQNIPGLPLSTNIFGPSAGRRSYAAGNDTLKESTGIFRDF